MLMIVKPILKSALKAIDLYNVAVGSYLANKNGLSVKRVGDSISITNKELRRSIIISSKHKAYV